MSSLSLPFFIVVTVATVAYFFNLVFSYTYAALESSIIYMYMCS